MTTPQSQAEAMVNEIRSTSPRLPQNRCAEVMKEKKIWKHNSIAGNAADTIARMSGGCIGTFNPRLKTEKIYE